MRVKWFHLMENSIRINCKIDFERATNKISSTIVLPSSHSRSGKFNFFSVCLNKLLRVPIFVEIENIVDVDINTLSIECALPKC